MDSLHIQNQLKLLNTLGYTLNIDQRMRLKLAHIKLMTANPDLDELKFWGKLQSITKNYYLMIGLKYHQCYQFPHKYFYWSSQDLQFKQLPDLILQHQQHCQKVNTLFSGDPNKILVNVQGDGQGQQPPPVENTEGQEGAPKKQIDEDQQQLKKIPKINFTQLNRLSYVVRAIENDCQVVPSGSYKMTPQNQLRPNIYFYGLSQKSATQMKSWSHFRSPQTPQARNKIQQDNVIFSSDFLDNLQNDLPKGVWSLQITNNKNIATCRNLTWPGYYAFHQLSTNIFGSVYLGDGIKNTDLSFML